MKFHTLVSPASKKKHVEYMAKRISKKQKKQRKLTVNEDSLDDEVVLKSPLGGD